MVGRGWRGKGDLEGEGMGETGCCDVEQIGGRERRERAGERERGLGWQEDNWGGDRPSNRTTCVDACRSMREE